MARYKLVRKSKRGGPTPCTAQGCGLMIMPGEDYYTWEFRFGGTFKQHSRHGAPKASQLTQSKMSGAYSALEDLDVALMTAEDGPDITQALDDCAESLESVRDEYQDGIDSMPEGLQQSAERATEAIEQLETAADSIRQAVDDIGNEWDDLENEPNEDHEDHAEWVTKRAELIEKLKNDAQEARDGVDL